MGKTLKFYKDFLRLANIVDSANQIKLESCGNVDPALEGYYIVASETLSDEMLNRCMEFFPNFKEHLAQTWKDFGSRLAFLQQLPSLEKTSYTEVILKEYGSAQRLLECAGYVHVVPKNIEINENVIETGYTTVSEVDEIEEELPSNYIEEEHSFSDIDLHDNVETISIQVIKNEEDNELEEWEEDEMAVGEILEKIDELKGIVENPERIDKLENTMLEILEKVSAKPEPVKEIATVSDEELEAFMMALMKLPAEDVKQTFISTIMNLGKADKLKSVSDIVIAGLDYLENKR